VDQLLTAQRPYQQELEWEKGALDNKTKIQEKRGDSKPGRFSSFVGVKSAVSDGVKFPGLGISGELSIPGLSIK
jgi:hypothetical protein